MLPIVEVLYGIFDSICLYRCLGKLSEIDEKLYKSLNRENYFEMIFSANKTVFQGRKRDQILLMESLYKNKINR